MIFRLSLVVVSLCGLTFAQQPAQPGQLPDPTTAQWRAMSVKEKLRYDARHVFDIDNFVFAGVGAAFDQARERPGEWGEGWGAFSERYASHIGQYFVQRSIMYPVQAIDHEDTRFFRSKHENYAARAGDAFCIRFGGAATAEA